MNTPENPALARQLQAHADQVSADLVCQEQQWSGKWTRRRMIKGIGMAGVAALGTQLVTTKVSFAATGASNGNTLIVVFLRGGADGLRMLVPAGSALGGDYLRTVRGPLVQQNSDLLTLAGAPGWALNKGFSSLMPFWNSGEMTFVPAVSAAGVTRSHFQAQQQLERGGSSAPSGWLDRTLTALGPGTTFRAVSRGYASPASMSGNEQKLSMSSLANFSFPGWDGVRDASMKAISTLYRGDVSVLGQDVPVTMKALGTAEQARKNSTPANGAVYPSGDFSGALADLATMLKSEVGLQVATVDVGGWDTHTNEAGDLDGLVTAASTALAAFLKDLGPTRRKRVTVAVMTEFGRRVQMNASNGTDHGTGSLMFLLGGGLRRSAVAGAWQPLSAGTLQDGDVPVRNQAFDVLGELIQKRLGVGTLGTVFPGFQPRPLDLATAS
ncbi:DUF1501 domain-containing protein [Nakamurella alba]|nr:DUF1501 domain-containing protein [Nakamurella alba]